MINKTEKAEEGQALRAEHTDSVNSVALQA